MSESFGSQGDADVAESEVAESEVAESEVAESEVAESGVAESELTASDVSANWEPTGDPRVDDAVDRLGDLASLPLDEQVAVYDEVQRRLQDALAGFVPDA